MDAKMSLEINVLVVLVVLVCTNTFSTISTFFIEVPVAPSCLSLSMNASPTTQPPPSPLPSKEEWAASIRAKKAPEDAWIKDEAGEKTPNTLWRQADSFENADWRDVQRICMQTWQYPSCTPDAKLEWRGFPPYTGGMLIRIKDEGVALPGGPNRCRSEFPIHWQPDESGIIRTLWLLWVKPATTNKPMFGGKIE